MKKTDLNLSLSTLIEVSPILGLFFDNRSRIRADQKEEIYSRIQEKTTLTLKNPEQKELYYFGCLDFLVYEKNGEKKFNFLEFNGTSIGGLLSTPLDIYEKMLLELGEATKYIKDPVPVIMIPFFTTLKETGAPVSKIFHERIVIAEYIKQALIKQHGAAQIVALPELLKLNYFKPRIPTIVIGHIKHFMPVLNCIHDRLCLFQQPISLSIQDNVCSKLFRFYKDSIKPDSFIAINPTYIFAANKGTAYNMFNEFIKDNYYPSLNVPIDYVNAYSREELINIVLDSLKKGKKLVIKPHASGIGKGVDFFFNNEPEEETIKKIDNSLKLSEIYQGEQSWIFPYTVCEFINSCVIKNEDSPMYKHKFEVRIVVYREEDKLKALPSIAKVSSKKYDETFVDRLMLLNNVSVSTATDIGLVDNFVLPLNNYTVLDTIDLSMDHLEELSKFSVNFIQYVIDNIDSLKDN